ncbi:hypothetical protein WKH57_25660 [Niallia taxi]|uniref:hypothetical protein n=1 Tax=Niallia taxi TaxID=2499688 RepID=UPI003180A8CD
MNFQALAVLMDCIREFNLRINSNLANKALPFLSEDTLEMINRYKENASISVFIEVVQYIFSDLSGKEKGQQIEIGMTLFSTRFEDLFNAFVMEEKKSPLLQITLDEENEVPEVFYKGEEIQLKRDILFHWETDSDVIGGLTYSIEHMEPGYIINRIERRVKGHACD